MRTAITGSSGFVGKHLLERITGDTYLYSRGEGMEGLLEFNPQVIYHCAGEIYQEDEMVESNILLTHRLLEAARKMPALTACIAIGSSSEYGRKDHPMSENDVLDPTTMYEATKGSASLLCQAYARTHGVPVMVARPFSLYGYHEPRHRFIPTIINCLWHKKILSLAPGVHDFIHIDDFIDGLFLLANHPRPGEIYNFGTGVQTRNDEVVELLEFLTRTSVKKKEVGSLHAYDSGCWVADIEKSNELGWTPRYTLSEGLEQVLERYRQEVL